MVRARANAERLAIPELSSNIRAYVAKMGQAQEAIERMLAAAEAAASRAVTEARRELRAESERLDECRHTEDPDCGWAAAAVQRSRSQLEVAQGVASDIRALRAQHQPAKRRFANALETLSQEVRRELQRAGETLDAYLGQTHAGASPGSSGSSSGEPTIPTDSTTSLSQPAGFPPDMYMVPLSQIDDSDTRVQGPNEFSKFYTPVDLEWAHEAFTSVVMPSVAAGAELDDFRARDRREGRLGVRSYEMTYAGFFGTDAIKLSPRDTKFEVSNGYHRIWVARQMGLDAIPARVRGHDIT